MNRVIVLWLLLLFSCYAQNDEQMLRVLVKELRNPETNIEALKKLEKMGEKAQRVAPLLEVLQKKALRQGDEKLFFQLFKTLQQIKPAQQIKSAQQELPTQQKTQITNVNSVEKMGKVTIQKAREAYRRGKWRECGTLAGFCLQQIRNLSSDKKRFTAMIDVCNHLIRLALLKNPLLWQYQPPKKINSVDWGLGNTVAYSYRDSILLYDISLQKQIGAFCGDGSEVQRLAWAPDHKHIAFTDNKNRVRIWKIQPNTVRTLFTAQSVIENINWHKSNVLVAQSKEIVHLWNMTDNYKINNIQVSSSLSLNHDAKLFATDRQMGIAVNGNVYQVGTGHDFVAPKFHPRADKVASFDNSATNAHTIKIWDVNSGKKRKSIKLVSTLQKDLDDYVDESLLHRYISWSRDGRFLISFDGMLMVLWDMEQYTMIASWQHRPVVSASWSSDSKYCVTTDSSHQVYLWDIEKHKSIGSITHGHRKITSLHWNSDNRSFYSSDNTGSHNLWSVTNCHQARWITSNKGYEPRESIDRTLIANKVGVENNKIVVQRRDGKAQVFVGSGELMQWRPNRSELAILNQNTLQIYHGATNRNKIYNGPTPESEWINPYPLALSWSPNGKFLAYTTSTDVVLYDGKSLTSIAKGSFQNTKLQWSRDSCILAYALTDNNDYSSVVKLYNTVTKTTQNCYRGEDKILQLAYGDHLVYFTNKTLYVRNINKNKIIQQFSIASDNTPMHVCWSKDQSTLALCGVKATLLWNSNTWIPQGVIYKHFIAHHQNFLAFIDNESQRKSSSSEEENVPPQLCETTIYIYDMHKNRYAQKLNAHKYRLTAISWSTDGKFLSSADEAGYICLWNVAQPSQALIVTSKEQQNNDITSDIVEDPFNDGILYDESYATSQNKAVMCSHDGKYIAVLRNDEIEVIDAINFSSVAKINTNDNEIKNAAWNPDKNVLAYSMREAMYLWDVSSKKNTKYIYFDHLQKVKWSPSGKLLATASKNGAIYIYDTTGQKQNALRGHFDAVSDFQWHPNSRHLVSISQNQDKKALLWDTYTGKIVSTIDIGKSINHLAWSSRGKRMAFCTDAMVYLWDGEVKLLLDDSDSTSSNTFEFIAWNNSDTAIAILTRSHEEAYILDVNHRQKTSLTPPGELYPSAAQHKSFWKKFTSDGYDISEFVTLDNNYSFLWKRYNGYIYTRSHPNSTSNNAQIRLNHPQKLLSHSWHPQGKILAYTGEDDSKVHLWKKSNIRHTSVTFPITSSFHSPDGKYALLHHNEFIHIIDSKTSKTLLKLTGKVSTRCWGPFSRKIVAIEDNNNIVLWDIFSKEKTNVGYHLNAHSVQWGASQTFVSISTTEIKLWSSGNSNNTAIIQNLPNNNFTSAAWSKDYSKLAIANTSSLWIWNVQKHLLEKEIPLQLENPISWIGWNYNSDKIAFLSDVFADSNVHIWNISTGKKIATHRSFNANYFAWAPHHDIFALAKFNMVSIIDLATNINVAILQGKGTLCGLQWCPANSSLYTTTFDGTLTQWHIPSSFNNLVPVNYDFQSSRINNSGNLRCLWWADKKTLMSSSTKELRFWGVDNKQHQVISQDEQLSVAAANDKSVAIAIGNKVKIYHRANGLVHDTLSKHKAQITALAWLQDSSFLATAAQDKTVYIWDTNKKTMEKQFSHPQQVIAVTWFKNGKQLLTATRDNIYVYDVVTQEIVHKLPGERIQHVSLHPDEKTLFTVENGNIKKWHIGNLRHELFPREKQVPLWYQKLRIKRTENSDSSIFNFYSPLQGSLLQQALNYKPRAVTEHLFLGKVQEDLQFIDFVNNK
ncbi:WD40 repeat domain-containing protein [Candidatus Uabimicrobium amorphum]|uniref:Anaphase-promoting complex subunit 4 WD40 domain-containing protein n=1 Tax=Uabimicrobium amorphum TaxID=2596890 RepID=A0A5S9IQG7_UABAM|nr:WD40 repeat domain-containing protein [Candidatus Uabimicrobium amorphum]BBM86218.1 hypothetical protein UABAM_04604 [Candidatus Uabimicrobium amorphum]